MKKSKIAGGIFQSGNFVAENCFRVNSDFQSNWNIYFTCSPLRLVITLFFILSRKKLLQMYRNVLTTSKSSFNSSFLQEKKFKRRPVNSGPSIACTWKQMLLLSCVWNKSNDKFAGQE